MDIMKVYVLVHEDHHTDPDIQVFGDKEAAIAAANEIASQYDDGPARALKENGPWKLFNGQVFGIQLTSEADTVVVYEREVAVA